MINSSSNITIIKGNIFTSKCQTLVNTVNCVGVMGAGIALEFKFRYPQMFKRYFELCQQNMIKIGTLWIYKNVANKLILNFPTKMHWKYPSKLEYVEKGLAKFLETYKEKEITSIAFPILGASKGGLDEHLVISIMQRYLLKANIPVEIYKYDPNADDDLYKRFKEIFLNTDLIKLKKDTKLRTNYIEKLKEALLDDRIRSLSRLATVNGIGIKTLEKSFQYAMNEKGDDELTLGL